MNIELDLGRWRCGEYSIAGNYGDMYSVWRTEDEDNDESEFVYENEDFEACLTWVYNS